MPQLAEGRARLELTQAGQIDDLANVAAGRDQIEDRPFFPTETLELAGKRVIRAERILTSAASRRHLLEPLEGHFVAGDPLPDQRPLVHHPETFHQDGFGPEG